MDKKMTEENYIDIKDFKELYTQNRDNGILVQDIKIAKTYRIPSYIKDDIKLYNVIKQNLLRYLTTQILEVQVEFPDDIFHINCKIKEYYRDEWPDSNIELYAIAYIFSGLRYKDVRR